MAVRIESIVQGGLVTQETIVPVQLLEEVELMSNDSIRVGINHTSQDTVTAARVTNKEHKGLDILNISDSE